MDIITNILSSMAASTGSHIVGSLFDQMMSSQDEITVDQLAGLGIVKTYSEIWPTTIGVADVLEAFAEDFETLRYHEFPTTEAREIVQLIYAPRIYLVRTDQLPKEVVLDLGDEQIRRFVDNALLNFLEFKGLDPETDLNYFVASLENNEFVEIEDMV